jgi:hypothetical protein
MFWKLLPSKQLKALKRIRQHKVKILAERGGKPLDIDPVAILQQIREERDEQLLNNFVNDCR